jgi:hypothetical protein
MKTARAEVGVYSSQPIQRETRRETRRPRPVSRQIRLTAEFQKKSVRPVSRRVYFFSRVTNPRARPIDRSPFYWIGTPESALVLK